MRLLLVEDDIDLGNALREGLQQESYVVDWVQDGKSAHNVLLTESFDTVILDLSLPKRPGLRILQELRAREIKTPVIILTARDTSEDMVKGLDLGADDYMTKPFDLQQLCARLRALQRRSADRASADINYRNLSLDPAAHLVHLDDNILNVSRREFALLQKLLENIGQVLSREQLAQSLYSWDQEVDSNALEVHIHNLRKKLPDGFIVTIRGIGYMIEPEE